MNPQREKTRNAGKQVRVDWNRRAVEAAAQERELLEQLQSRMPRGGTPWDYRPRTQYFDALSPEDRVAMLDEAEYFSPANPAPRYTKALNETVRYPLEVFSRPRDTLISAGQSASGGDYLGALGKLVAAPVSMAIPAVASGRVGDPDDWQEKARQLGIDEATIMGLDLGTDPSTYIGYGAARKAAGTAARMAGFARKARQVTDSADRVRSLAKEIEALRRQAAKLHHPDRGGSAEAMKAINRAADEGNVMSLLRYAK